MALLLENKNTFSINDIKSKSEMEQFTFYLSEEYANLCKKLLFISQQLDLNEEIQIEDNISCNLLYYASLLNSHYLVKNLLEKGYDPLYINKKCNNETAIHVAARNGRTDILTLLLYDLPKIQLIKAVQMQNIYFDSPLRLAMQEPRAEIILCNLIVPDEIIKLEEERYDKLKS